MALPLVAGSIKQIRRLGTLVNLTYLDSLAKFHNTRRTPSLAGFAALASCATLDLVPDTRSASQHELNVIMSPGHHRNRDFSGRGGGSSSLERLHPLLRWSSAGKPLVGTSRACEDSDYTQWL
jgi:hypothetical protein